jgi:dolichol-phosphate mannosyltransferase
VNDGSKDKSGSIVENFIAQHPDLGIKYTYQERKPDGSNTKGSALKNGFALATGDLFIIQDADLEYDPSDYIPLIQKLEKEGADFAYGSRTLGYFKFGTKYSTMGFLL